MLKISTAPHLNSPLSTRGIMLNVIIAMLPALAVGLLSGDYSYATAVGLFTNIVNLILLLSVNKVSAKVTDTSLF